MRLQSSSPLVFLLLVSLQACVVSTTEQNRLEPFDRTDDYDYGLESLENANNYRVDLTEEGFSWPSLPENVDTAFLEFQIQAAATENPAITLAAGNTSLVQYFEQGGQGRRYLDVSPLLQDLSLIHI